MVTFGTFELNNYANSLVVVDENVAKLHKVAGNNVFVLPQGEQCKTYQRAMELCSWFLERNLERNGKVVAVGGGSVGDVVGFAVSIYKRGGVHLTHVPTTLLAQIDSSIGGKTAVNLGLVKNAVGTFYPADTFVDSAFLATLPPQEMQNGMGELLKYRMLCNDVNRAATLAEQIAACICYKSEICAKDPLDNGIRHKLNFGHTVGHAMELALNLPHGVAVANGIYYETLLARKLGLVTADYAEYWTSQVTSQFRLYPLEQGVLNLLVTDKKNVDGNVCFVLPTNFDNVFLMEQKAKKLLKNA